MVLIKSLSEVRENASSLPMASLESYLAVRRFKNDGGETNVPIRGVQPMTFEIMGDDLTLSEGRRFDPGTDEVIVGRSLVDRIRGCRLEDVIVLNTTPFRVVGIFEHEGPYASEIWGDVERMAAALERPAYNRVIALLKPRVDLEKLAARLENHPEVPAKVLTEREYLSNQIAGFTIALSVLATVLALIMGAAAVFTATNTMLAAIGARTHEIGILLSIGFRPFAIFLSFLLEALALGLLGGVIGCLMVLPLNGARTGTTNPQSFTEVAFAFRVTPTVMVQVVIFALLLGLVGGMWPAWRAARMQPTRAPRRG